MLYGALDVARRDAADEKAAAGSTARAAECNTLAAELEPLCAVSNGSAHWHVLSSSTASFILSSRPPDLEGAATVEPPDLGSAHRCHDLRQYVVPCRIGAIPAGRMKIPTGPPPGLPPPGIEAPHPGFWPSTSGIEVSALTHRPLLCLRPSVFILSTCITLSNC